MLNKFSITLMLSSVNMTYKSKNLRKTDKCHLWSVKLWKKPISNNTLILLGFYISKPIYGSVGI